MSESFDRVSNYELLEKGLQIDFLCTLCEEETEVDRSSLAECVLCHKKWCYVCAVEWYKHSRTCPFCRNTKILYPFDDKKEEEEEEEEEDVPDREVIRKIFMLFACFSICLILAFLTYNNGDLNDMYYIIDLVAMIYLCFFIYLVSESLCHGCR